MSLYYTVSTVFSREPKIKSAYEEQINALKLFIEGAKTALEQQDAALAPFYRDSILDQRFSDRF